MLALGALLLLAGFAVTGPTGLLAWSENADALEARQAEIASLTAKRDALRNRVMLLDPEAADPDLASELVRDQLGVMREDEVVITLDDE
jgi:cell division protein FtsB